MAELIDIFDDFALGVVLAHYVNVGIAVAHQLNGIGNKGHGRGVHHNVVVMLLKSGNQLPKFGIEQQFGRIGRNGPGRNQIERAFARGLNDFLNAVLANEVGGEVGIVGEAKVVENFRFA